MSSALPTPSSSARIASARNGISIRFTMNPGRSADTMTRLPRSADRSRTVAAVSSVVSVPRTSSTSGITGTGLKKCIPTKRAATLRRDGRGERVDRDRARVRGEDRAGRARAVELRPEPPLDLHVLVDRLDDEAGSGGVGGVGGRPDPREHGVAGRRPRDDPSRPPGRGSRRSARDRPRLGPGPARRARPAALSRRRPGRSRGPSARRRRRIPRSIAIAREPTRPRPATGRSRLSRRATRRPAAKAASTAETRNVAP